MELLFLARYTLARTTAFKGNCFEMVNITFLFITPPPPARTLGSVSIDDSFLSKLSCQHTSHQKYLNKYDHACV